MGLNFEKQIFVPDLVYHTLVFLTHLLAYTSIYLDPLICEVQGLCELAKNH